MEVRRTEEGVGEDFRCWLRLAPGGMDWCVSVSFGLGFWELLAGLPRGHCDIYGVWGRIVACSVLAS